MPPSISLVSPDVIQKILHSIDPNASMTSDAKEILSKVFNYHSEKVLKYAYQRALNRTSCSLSDQLRNAKNLGVIETAASHAGTVEFLKPFDSAPQLEVSDIMKKLKLPDDCQISLATPEDTNLFGPIKPFHFLPSLQIATPNNSPSKSEA